MNQKIQRKQNLKRKHYLMQRSCIIRFENEVFPFKDGFQKKESGMSDKSIQNWVKEDKKRFNGIKSQIQQTKNSNLQTRPERGSPIYFNESYKLIQDIEHRKITHEEALEIITHICYDIKRINDLDDFNENQLKVVNDFFMVDKMVTGELNWDKLTDGGYKLLRSKIYQKESDKAEQKSDIEVLNIKLKTKKRT